MTTSKTEHLPDTFPWVTRDEVFRVESPRLWLRWLRATDANALQRIAGIAAVAEMTSTWAHPLPAGEAGRRIAAARALNRDGKSLIMGITLKGAPDVLVGTIGSGAPAEGAATIGYMLDPALQDRGIATEAVRAFVRMLFTHTDVELIAASCRVTNTASRRVLEKNGFEIVRSGAFETKVRGEIEVDFHELSRRDWKTGLTATRADLERASATTGVPGRNHLL